MKRASLGLFTSLALGLVAHHAEAVQINSATVQSGRTEGQSIAVSAAVDFQDPPPPVGKVFVNPLIRTSHIVTATVAAPATSVPAIATTVSLVLDAASGLYKGTFAELPFDNYQVKITATRRVDDASHLPATSTSTSAVTNRSLSVLEPVGCFDFRNQSLQGVTVKGFFDADTTTIVTPAKVTPAWSSVGFFGLNATDGSVFLDLSGAHPPSANQVDEFYRFDVVSPDLSANQNWQNLTGVSFRFMSTNSEAYFLHAVVRARKPDGSIALFTQTDANGVPLTAPALGDTFQTMIDRVAMPAGSTVVGVDVRVFGDPELNPPNLFVDAICPRH
jgi:hypothetical protein